MNVAITTDKQNSDETIPEFE